MNIILDKKFAKYLELSNANYEEKIANILLQHIAVFRIRSLTIALAT